VLSRGRARFSGDEKGKREDGAIRYGRRGASGAGKTEGAAGSIWMNGDGRVAWWWLLAGRIQLRGLAGSTVLTHPHTGYVHTGQNASVSQNRL